MTQTGRETATMTYIPRMADEDLSSALARMGGVLIEGPKACGKTRTALQAASSAVHLDNDPRAAELFAIDPQLLLRGSTPRLLDEWQIYPDIWNYARHEIDRRQAKGQFILTGSTAPSVDQKRHSGAGRISRVRMRTLSLWESGHSDGSVSLRSLLQGSRPLSTDRHLAFDDLLERLVIGGWPANQNLEPATAQANMVDYLDDVAQVDIRAADGISRNPGRVFRLIRSLARHTGSEATVTTLAKDVGTTWETLRDDWDALVRIFIADPQHAWSTHLRSSATLRKEPKRHLADPSLAAAALGAGPEALAADPEFTGQLFESQVIHDLRVYATAAGGTVYHARDSKNREVDAIIQLPNGSWHAFEVKLGSRHEVVDAAADSLVKFAHQVEAQDQLTGLTIITGGDLSHPHRTHPQVSVVSIGHLRP